MKRKTIFFIIAALIAGFIVVVNTQSKHAMQEVVDDIYFYSNVELTGSKKMNFDNYSKKKYFKKLVIKEINKLINTKSDEESFSIRKNIKNVIEFYSNLTALGYYDEEATSMFENFIINEMSNYIAEQDFKKCTNIISLLDSYQIYSSQIKISFTEILDTLKEELFRSDSKITIKEYISGVERNLVNSYYTTVIECFPYDEMSNYIKNSGVVVICEQGIGGYFDDREPISNSYWVDPLSNRMIFIGSIGTYNIKKSTNYIGDFMIESESKQWYGTPSNDPNNYSNTKVYYKYNHISNCNYSEFKVFLNKAKKGTCYSVDNCLFVIEKDAITVMDDSMFTIAYK